MKIYCDGSGWNGKSVGYCVLKEDGTLYEEVFETYRTSVEMEYMAVLAAFTQARPGDIVFCDCAVIVDHLKKGKKVKSEALKSMYEKAKTIMHPRVKILKISRNRNKAGIYLEKAKKMRAKSSGGCG
jgi:ribonuclease HI